MSNEYRPGGIISRVPIPSQAVPSGSLQLVNNFSVLLPLSRAGDWQLSVTGRVFVYNPAALTTAVVLTLSGAIPNDMPDEYWAPINATATSIGRTLTYRAVIGCPAGRSPGIDLYLSASEAGMSIQQATTGGQVISSLVVSAIPI